MILIAAGMDDDGDAELEALVSGRCCYRHGPSCPGSPCCVACTEGHHGWHRDVPGGPVLHSHHDGSICVSAAVS